MEQCDAKRPEARLTQKHHFFPRERAVPKQTRWKTRIYGVDALSRGASLPSSSCYTSRAIYTRIRGYNLNL